MAGSDAVSCEPDRLTLRDVTCFYLGEDPADPGLIPSYRAGITHNQHARWHLAAVMKAANVGDARAYDQVDISQTHLEDYLWREPLSPNGPYPEEGELLPDDRLMEEEAMEERELPQECPTMEDGALFPAEVEVIVEEKLEVFFEPGLRGVACAPSTSSPQDFD